MTGVRRHKRIIKRLETECSSEGVVFRGISSDLSGGGLFVRTSKPFSPDTAVDLTIHLPGNSVAKIKGIVRRSVRTGLAYGKNGMGIEIIEFDEEFAAYVNSLLPTEERIQQRKRFERGVVESSPGNETLTGEKAMEGRSAYGSVLGPASHQAVPPAAEKDETDEAVDSLLQSLFSKGDKKKG